MTPKRVPFVTIALVLLLAALPILAFFQYRWLGQVRSAEETRLEQSARRAALQFASDLAGEFSVFRSLFSISSDEVQDEDWSGFVRRYEFWRANTRFPGFVREIFLREGDSGAFRVFTPGEGFSEPMVDAEVVFGDESAGYLLPAYRSTDTLLLVRVDKTYFREAVIPFFAEEHFGTESAHQNFAVEVRDRAEMIYRSEDYPEGASPMQTVGPLDGLRMIAAPALTVREGPRPEERPEDQQSFLLSGLQVEELGTQLEEVPPGADTPAVREWIITARPVEERATSPFAASAGGLQIGVAHVAGSLEAAVARTQTRNLVISFGILIVLGAGLLALFVLYQRAVKLARREREFLASVTHELRTPIAALYSAGENLEAGVVTDPTSVRDYGSLVKRQGSRLRGMVDRVLGYATLVASPGRQRAPAAAEPIDVAALVRRLVEMHRADARGKHIDLSVRAEVGVIGVDGGAVEIIVNNLVGNALRHAHGAGSVEVVLSKSAGNLVLSVEDDGPGVDRKELRFVFEPFFRGRRSAAAQVPGTGVGLSLVKRVAEYHGGTVEYKRGAAGGACFVVTLPVADADPTGAQPPRPQPPRPQPPRPQPEDGAK